MKSHYVDFAALSLQCVHGAEFTCHVEYAIKDDQPFKILLTLNYKMPKLTTFMTRAVKNILVTSIFYSFLTMF